MKSEKQAKIGHATIASKKKGATKSERAIYAIGRPKLEKLSKTEEKVFYDTLLFYVTEYFKNGGV